MQEDSELMTNLYGAFTAGHKGAEAVKDFPLDEVSSIGSLRQKPGTQ
jgi:hypothetical protein